MAHVELERLGKTFGAFEAIRDVSLGIEKGEFCALLGPSGCGKSTLLRLIAGLEDATTGTIRIDGRDVTELAPAERQIAMVFQSYALYPHMTVSENIAFSLEVAGMRKAARASKAADVARLLKLDQLLDRRPSMLSGGQRQRVAIGRALVRDPQVFLFDEPLSNLDAMLRVQMRLELSNLHHELAATMIYVTHDQVEAMTMADRIVVLDQGRISQVGSPMELYERPANRFVAAFIGSPSMNFVSVELEGLAEGGAARLSLGDRSIDAPRRDPQSGKTPVEFGFRPENARLTVADSSDAVLSGRTKLVERLGNQTLVHVETPVGLVTVQGQGNLAARIGDTAGVSLDIEKVHLFDAAGLVI